MRHKILQILFAAFATLGLLIADTVVKKRDFTGKIDVQVYEKDATGQWKLADELNASGVHFAANVTDLAGQKGVASDFSFSGTTKKGIRISVRLKPGGKGDADLTTGFLALDLPFEITINGKKADSSLKLTTDSAPGATGSISGRRARINKGAHTADLALVGSVALQGSFDLPTTSQPGTVDQKAEERGQKSADRLEAIKTRLLVVKGDGILKALN